MTTSLFTSERLRFRLFTMEDVMLIHELNHDPEVLKYAHELPSTPERAQERLTNSLLLQYRQHGYGRWAVHLKEDDTFIGWCGLKFRPERNETDLGYRFKKAYWGKGYATEAACACINYGFQRLLLQRITATAHVENIASQKVLQHTGMHYTHDDIIDHCPVRVFEVIRQI